MALPIKKRINIEPFIVEMAALYKEKTRINNITIIDIEELDWRDTHALRRNDYIERKGVGC